MIQEPQGRATSLISWLKQPSFTQLFNDPATVLLTKRVKKPAALLAAFTLAAHMLVSSAPAANQDNSPTATPETPQQLVPLKDGSMASVRDSLRYLPLQKSVFSLSGGELPNLAADLGQGLRDDNITIDGEQSTSAEQQAHIDGLMALVVIEKPNATHIRKIQTFLNTMDYGAGREDGRFGAKTSAAFAAFLKDNRSAISAVSPWIIDRLAHHDQGEALAAIIDKNPAASAALQARFPIATQNSGKIAFTLSQEPSNTLTPLPRNRVAEMQKILKIQGYQPGKPDGDFGFRTAGALMKYLNRNPDDIAVLSPWLLQQLMRHGHQESLTDTIHSNPTLWARVSERLRTETQAMNAQSKQSVMATQSVMRAAGIYTGSIDGIAGRGTQAAIDDLNYYFSTADITNLRKESIDVPSVHSNDSIAQKTPRSTAPVDITAADAAQLARDAGFRTALSRGDFARVNRYLLALDTTPLHLEHPVEGKRVSSRFGPRYVAGIDRRVRMHQGTDFSAATGTKIESAAGGRVVVAGTHGHYGRSVMIDHGHNVLTHYAHMSRVNVKVGDVIQPGQIIGAVGATGRVRGSHLHFETILRDRDGTPVVINAEKFMNRDLSDPQVRLAAIADSRLTARNQGWKEARVTSRFAEKRAPEGAGLQAGLTPANAKVLLEVLAADRTLLASVPRGVLVGLRDMGYRNELNQLAYSNGTGRTIALTR
jgi:murein DD-endopeptidase MepM/ murein hydrolase activator NlpD